MCYKLFVAVNHDSVDFVKELYEFYKMARAYLFMDICILKVLVTSHDFYYSI